MTWQMQVLKLKKGDEGYEQKVQRDEIRNGNEKRRGLWNRFCRNVMC